MTLLVLASSTTESRGNLVEIVEAEGYKVGAAEKPG
jgi:hypothetical protein